MAANELEVGAPVKLKTRTVGSTLGIVEYRVRGGEGKIVSVFMDKDDKTKLYEIALTPSGRRQIAKRDDLVARHKKKRAHG